ncbi:hypothetical protein [Chloroflexus sp.]|uniref:hypothetical protein n=1 Tax=Chloroflexus sp. TaxID=1904827 RepID=UPI002ACDF1EB|nr:hypothetical protein [Chloroflexus sp.]
MSMGNNWRVLIKRWLVPASMAALSEIIGRIPEDARVYRRSSKPASADSSGAGLGTPAQAGTLYGSKAGSQESRIVVCYRPGERNVDGITVSLPNYILDEDTACGLVYTGTKSITFIPWDSILYIDI